MSKEEKRVKGYKIEADTDMTGHGFRKRLRWKEVDERGGRWYITTYDFDVKNYSCHTCKSSDWTWLSPQRTGVYKVCLKCQRTTGPLTLSDAIQIGEPQEVSPEEARDLILSRQMKVPENLENLCRVRASRVKEQGKPAPDIETF